MISENSTQPVYSPTLDSSISRRIGAFLIDSIVLGVLAAIGAHIIPFIGGVVVWFFYAPILESSEVRATLGKHLMGIQVADLMGRRISLRASLIRNVLKIVSASFLLIGFLPALFTRRKQTMHDLLADTVVLYGRSETPIVDAWIEESKEAFRSGEARVRSATERVTSGSPSSSNPAAREDIASQLERLETLRRNGSLTEIEFEQAKRKILE